MPLVECDGEQVEAWSSCFCKGSLLHPVLGVAAVTVAEATAAATAAAGVLMELPEVTPGDLPRVRGDNRRGVIRGVVPRRETLGEGLGETAALGDDAVGRAGCPIGICAMHRRCGVESRCGKSVAIEGMPAKPGTVESERTALAGLQLIVVIMPPLLQQHELPNAT